MGGALDGLPIPSEESGSEAQGLQAAIGGKFGGHGLGRCWREVFALLNPLGSLRGRPEMTPALLPWQPWGLEKVVSIHRPVLTGAGSCLGVRVVPGIPTALAGLFLPLSMSRCPKWKPYACLSRPWRGALKSVSAVTQGTLGGCSLIAEGASETARGGPDIEEVLTLKTGRKEPLSLGLTLQGRCLYTKTQVQVSASLSQAPSSGHSVIIEFFHPHQNPESSTFRLMDTVTGNDRIRFVLKSALLCPEICF